MGLKEGLLHQLENRGNTEITTSGTTTTEETGTNTGVRNSNRQRNRNRQRKRRNTNSGAGVVNSGPATVDWLEQDEPHATVDSVQVEAVNSPERTPTEGSFAMNDGTT